jgi:hypothetical protein
MAYPWLKRNGEWRFAALTGVIVAWMLLSPLLRDTWIMHLLLQLVLLNTLVVTLWANPGWRRLKATVLVLWAVALAGSLLSVLPLPSSWQALGRAAEITTIMPVTAACALGILWFAFRSRRLNVDGVFATVVAYLLIALVFAQAYLLLLAWDPDSLQLPTGPAGERAPGSLQADAIYFSVVTLATLGYGDILPRSDLARTLAIIEAVVGQFYIAVVVAVFVGMYASQPRGGSDRSP